MNTLAIAYFIAWVSVSAYLGWLGIQHRRLAHRLHNIELQPPDSELKQSRAA